MQERDGQADALYCGEYIRLCREEGRSKTWRVAGHDDREAHEWHTASQTYLLLLLAHTVQKRSLKLSSGLASCAVFWSLTPSTLCTDESGWASAGGGGGGGGGGAD